MTSPSLWLTAAETVDVVAACEPTLPRLTYARLRYWDDEGIVPACRLQAGGARLYTAEDAAMLRLALRVLHDGRGLRQVSEALRYRSDEIRAAFHSRRPMVVLFGARSLALVCVVSQVPAGCDAYPLRECYDRVEDAIRAVRQQEPRLWDGWRRVPATEV